MDIDEKPVDEFENALLSENFDDAFFQDEAFENSVNRTNLNKSINNNNLNVSALCCDEEISGYDKLIGKTWIYPTNYPIREYQFNIIKASILKNTLVSLPTGLGKTFIAAVIMYNFYRWYPLGKIIFTAPTRPLVKQQILACYNIVGIPPNDTIEMTGTMQPNKRKVHWETKRVFFATPQVIYNDIKYGVCPGEKIRCLVIDEAHKAHGNYAYCQIVSTLTEMGHKTYRILALSATPGSNVKNVVTVVNNLHIAHLEFRTEECKDVAPYSHSREINTVVVQLDPDLTQLRHEYLKIIDGYAHSLKELKILPQNVDSYSKGRIIMLYKNYQCREKNSRCPQHNNIMNAFTRLIPLYQGLDLLVRHGSRVFLNFFDEHLKKKSWIQSDNQLIALLERLRDDLGTDPLSLNKGLLPNGTVSNMPENLCFGHPKFYKLKQIMVEHFETARKAGQDTRAIVFCEYRQTVNLVRCLLLQCQPLIKPQIFVGQGVSGKEDQATVSQKQQMRVMRDFRAGVCNALVATCVAEEGLDVGSVDLVLCFDILTRSPIRLVQRCGRTGRERNGKVYILVTEGREYQTLLDCMRQKDGLNKKIMQSEEVANNLYKLNPRMVPMDFVPECQKMYITVAQVSNKEETPKSSKKKNKRQRKVKTVAEIGHSKDIEPAVELLDNCDTKRLDMPPSPQNPTSLSQNLKTQTMFSSSQFQCKPTKKKQKVVTKSSNKNNDIRTYFSAATNPVNGHMKLINELGAFDREPLSISRNDLLSDLTMNNANLTRKCYICQHICDCFVIRNVKKVNLTKASNINLTDLKFPNVSLLDELTSEITINHTKILEENFDIGNIEDIFAENTPIETEEVQRVEDDNKNQSSVSGKETLDFFGLDSIDDIFADSDETSENKTQSQDKTTDRNICTSNNNLPIIQQLSPSILSGKQIVEEPKSPILCSQVRKLNKRRIYSRNYSSGNEKSLKAVDGFSTRSYICNDYNKGMITVPVATQLEPNRSTEYNNGRSSSPIIMTSADRRKILSNTVRTVREIDKRKSEKNIVILDSDSDSNDKTQEYRIEDAFPDISNNVEKRSIYLSPMNSKRKVSIEDNEVSTLSPYFNISEKLNDEPFTLPDKVLAACKSMNNFRCTQKENQNPQILQLERTDQSDKDRHNGAIDALQKFKCDLNHNKSKRFDDRKKLKINAKFEKQIICSDGDDDFVDDINQTVPDKSMNNVTNHKFRKKKTKNKFLDEEAIVSDDGLDGSGDELTDDSVGSVADFICDNNVTHNGTDEHALYLRSVRSPVKGVFKIPKLTSVNNNDNIFSQTVEEDTYEMDSFCVDSHVGLTQVTEETELELAEKRLKKKRKKRTKETHREKTVENSDSPVIKRRRVQRKAIIYSDDSS